MMRYWSELEGLLHLLHPLHPTLILLFAGQVKKDFFFSLCDFYDYYIICLCVSTHRNRSTVCSSLMFMDSSGSELLFFPIVFYTHIMPRKLVQIFPEACVGRSEGLFARIWTSNGRRRCPFICVYHLGRIQCVWWGREETHAPVAGM